MKDFLQKCKKVCAEVPSEAQAKALQERLQELRAEVLSKDKQCVHQNVTFSIILWHRASVGCM